MIIDFHTHTHHSYDSNMKPEKILFLAKKRGLTAIVINDHNTIKGGLECKKINKYKDLEVIIGAEILTDIGDVTGIFLTKEIKSHNYKDVINEIKEQGGYSILNHPYKGHKLDNVDFSLFDFIEGYNSRLSDVDNKKAVDLAKKHNKPIIYGSDAHCYNEIANCKTIYNNNDIFSKPEKYIYKRSNSFNILKSQYIKAWKRKSIKLAILVSLKYIKQIFVRTKN